MNRSMAIYHPSRRGLSMTFSYTRPLPRIMGNPVTAPLTTKDKLLVSPLRPLVNAATAVLKIFRAA